MDWIHEHEAAGLATMAAPEPPLHRDSDMLVLSRTASEEIIIGSGSEQIRVVVVSTSGGKVRLGFDAPKDCPIVRSELIQRRGGEFPNQGKPAA